MFKEIPKSDISVKPFKVYKEYSVNESTNVPYFGKQVTGSYFFDEDNDFTQGVSKKVLYDSIKAQFYLNPQTASVLTEGGLRENYTSTNERNLGTEFVLISIPQEEYGENIKIGSVELTTGSVTYTDDGNSNLISGSGDVVGNIFYDQGLIIWTDNVTSGSTLETFQLDYRATTTIYENEIFIPIKEGEFNISQNPSANDNGFIKYDGYITSVTGSNGELLTGSNGEVITGGFGDYHYSSSIDPTGSYLAPFITTIGLYDDNGTMVANAKLATPIKKLPDYPINFLIRLDT